VLAAGVALTLAGMAWHGRIDVGSSYLTAVALPMVLIGAGQGLAFAPVTSALTDRVTTALTVGSLLLVAAFILTITLIAWRRPGAPAAGTRTTAQPGRTVQAGTPIALTSRYSSKPWSP
jgi:hypothetical protein